MFFICVFLWQFLHGCFLAHKKYTCLCMWYDCSDMKSEGWLITCGLIFWYTGKILNDDTALKEYKIDEKNFVVVMVAKVSLSVLFASSHRKKWMICLTLALVFSFWWKIDFSFNIQVLMKDLPRIINISNKWMLMVSVACIKLCPVPLDFPYVKDLCYWLTSSHM